MHGDVHLGIAVDLDYEGLIVPVVHNAGTSACGPSPATSRELAERARTKKLSADDITGGTVTITNVGSSGNLLLLPIINQPQVMILSTDGVVRRPVVVNDLSGGESIAIHSVGTSPSAGTTVPSTAPTPPLPRPVREILRDPGLGSRDVVRFFGRVRRCPAGPT